MQRPEEIWREIQEKMEELGYGDSDVGKATGLGRDLTRKWRENPSAMPAYNKVVQIRGFLGLDESRTLLPMLGRVPAGIPIAVDAPTFELAERIEVPRVKPHWFLLEVWGDSMNLVAQEGYLLAVNPIFDVKALDGRYVIANYNGEATFKCYRSAPIVMLEPRSTNPKHRSIVPRDGDELQIQGVVELVIGDLSSGT